MLGYAVFRDEGDQGMIGTEVNADSDSNVRDDPSLRSLLISHYPANPLGLVFMY